ncbi:MAG: carboxypeptidase regulatory-like domain-containing protein, partial [Myxococcota bacterium]|nr:carboxypeptidase regulatory-like domain-containing protein [Myxococcota bacterium]
LYNVIVYVPGAAVGPLESTGVSCDKCGGTVSGSPVAAVLTDATGHFTLKGVPAGKDISLVMQVGKWRRIVTVPSVAECAETAISNHDLTRLPRNQSEGSIPRIAIATGGADPLECLLRKVGVDDSEFTTAGGSGRVHLYAGGGWTDAQSVTHPASSQFATSLNAGAAFVDATTLWNSATNLQTYDMLLMACEGTLNAATKPLSARQALSDFAAVGGRLFASHWHRYWFSDGPSPVPSVGTWTDRIDPAASGTIAIGTVDSSFPKGMALRDWLVNVGASTTPGQLPIKDSKHNLDAVNLAEAQQWITLPNPNANNRTAVEYTTFNTPVGQSAGAQCGRVVYSDLHVSSGDQPGEPFPMGCVTTELSPQEKALEFMLFDLSSCVQTDGKPPQSPLY